MIYNGFRRIALAHSLLPSAQSAQRAGDTGEHLVDLLAHEPGGQADTLPGAGPLAPAAPDSGASVS